jgi:hypothetical protein
LRDAVNDTYLKESDISYDNSENLDIPRGRGRPCGSKTVKRTQS